MNQQKTLVLRPLTDQELTELNATQGAVHVYDLSTFKALTARPNITYQPFAPEHQLEAQHVVQKEIDAMPVKTNGKSIVDFLSYNGLNLWYYHRSRAYFDVYSSYLQQITLRDIDKTEHCRIYADKVLQSKFEKEKEFTFVEPKKINNPLGRKLGSIKYIISLVIRGLLGIKKLHTIRKIKHLLLLFPNTKTSKVPTNEFYGRLLEIDRSGTFGLLDIHKPAKLNDGRTRWNIKLLFRKTNYPLATNDTILLRYGFLSLSSIRKARAYKKELEQQLESLKNQDTSEIQDQLIARFASYRSSSAYYCLLFQSYSRFLKTSKIETITAHSEQDSIVRAVLDAGKTNGIATNGIQHGAINKNNRAYVLTEADHKYTPFPDHMLVWGDAIRDFLINESSCNPQKVHTLGQLRSDSLFQLPEKITHPILTTIPTKQTKIIFASQPQPDLSQRKQAAIDTIAAANDLDNVTLIIKVHPGEEKKYYHQIIKDMNAKNVIVLKDEIDLYQLIKGCDALVTCFSTVGAETVYFNKPLLVLDYSGLDKLNFVASGVGKAVTTVEEIKSQFNRISQCKFEINQECYDQFVQNYASKLDGKTAERYHNFIYRKSGDQ